MTFSPGVNVDHPDAVPRALRMVGGESHRPGERIAEEHLRHGFEVCGHCVAPHGEESKGCPAARAVMAALAIRAWYLPWWVSMA
jgi:hypothetical protein